MYPASPTPGAAHPRGRSPFIALQPLDVRQPAATIDERILGTSESMRRLKQLIEKVAATHSTALITGETGTGKELLAHAIHDLGERAGKPFLPINCGAFSEPLLESELFGYVKGAFTGATANRKGLFVAAHGGTIFLDELGEMSPAMQVKLLRVLQERKVRPVGSTEAQEISIDVRVIAATNKNLTYEVEQGRFREDLFYRLNVVPICVPPLRERRRDIPVLTHHLLVKVQRSAGLKAPARIEPTAERRLCQHHWPGNVRELENTLERLSVMVGGGSVITADDVSAMINDPREAANDGIEYVCVWKDGTSFDEHCDLQQLAFYDRMLETCGGNHSEVARRLKVRRTTLLRHMKHLRERTAATP